MKNNSIVVIGANQCALVFAQLAANAGFEVVCLEAKSKEDVAYDWTDDMTEQTFSCLGMPLPPKEVYTRKRSWTFVPPNKGSNIYVELPENELDLAIYRRPFNSWLEQRALEAGASVRYGVAVKQAIVSGVTVKGVMLESGEELAAGLVVDCGGVNSCVRRTLPESLNIQNEVPSCEQFFVRRTFFERPEGTKRPEHTNKAYLKHIGECGISWCILSHDEKCADVLIGRLGELSDETFTRALADLRDDNDIIGDKTVKGGELLKIPVRRPLPQLFANGYVLLGDSACMTIPMLGSGMASGMRAAKILSDVIKKPVGGVFSAENLFRYQRDFMRETGARHSAVDMMKCWLLDSSAQDIDFLLNNGVVCKSVLKQASAGEMVKMTVAETLGAGISGRKKPALLLKLVALLGKMNTRYSVARGIPRAYSEESFNRWREKYENS